MHFHDTLASLPITLILSPHFHTITSARSYSVPKTRINLRATSFAKLIANLPNEIVAYEDPSTPLLQVLLSLSTDIIKDSYQHLSGNMGEFPDLKKRTVEEAIVRKWGERICVMGSEASVS